MMFKSSCPATRMRTWRWFCIPNRFRFRVVLSQQTLSNVFPFEAVPTSFFVDRSGAFLGTKITGALTDEYEPALEPLLAKVQEKAQP